MKSEKIRRAISEIDDDLIEAADMIPEKSVSGSFRKWSAAAAVLVILIAAGFLGSEEYVTKDFCTSVTERGNVRTAEGSYLTDREGVFAAGDMHRGQSLVVWAIAEGRAAAAAVDESLMGYTNL